MGRLFLHYLASETTRTFKCKECATDIAAENDLYGEDSLPDTTVYEVAKNSREMLDLCSLGQTLLFCAVQNVTFGIREHKVLNSGFYSGQKIYCKVCHSILGWHYIESDNKQVAFKEGKISIHSLLMTRSSVVQGGKANKQTSEELLDIEAPTESSVVSASTARSN